MKMKIDPYFLTETCPYSKKRKINVKRLKLICAVLTALTVVALLVSGWSAEKKEKEERTAIVSSELSVSPMPIAPAPQPSESLFEKPSYSSGRGGGTRTSPRQYTASQIVGSNGGDSGFFLPMGTMIAARLTTRLISSDAASPAVAEVSSDVFGQNQVLIPEGTKVLGHASFDGSGERLQVRFSTLVYPDGSQHQLSALALLADGSSGLAGDYHSDALRHQLGSFLGFFVGGMAEGMQDRQSMGSTGITIQAGSLRNGVLNGLATSSLGEGKALADDVKKVHPYLDVPGGTPFLLYLEKEYSP